MEAEIKKETNNGFGVTVLDNNGVKHKVGVLYDGDISGHLQDGYPDDPSERTQEENEHVNQARRFAKYWVYRKRGYDTLDPLRNPDRILASVIAIAPLTPEMAEQHFGDLYQQYCHIYDDAEPTVDLPDGVGPKDPVYLKDVYLGIGDGGLDAGAATILGDPDMMDLVGATVNVSGDRPIEGEYLPKFHELLAAAADVNPDSLPSLREGLLIDDISGIHVQTGSFDGPTIQYGRQPEIDRKPDARIQLDRLEVESVTDLQIRLANHLICQVRDCYLLMGIAPPEPFRIQGVGIRGAVGWFNSIDLYEMYWNSDAEISSWFEAHTPDDAYEHTGESVTPEA
ncbi:hypothetical protein C483_17143 [Natrialba hulunbeirensis JCM 10989]|uniref:Uncharacterized protein n=1 Tax=Natrialba hulunbeirensis JCM 10989 TaxID=1227493 RepID=L9ZNK5_9EURY|nr:hypothetical protein [Natrialba hulunbeirensis]ELY87646.1 hypothetical protein C483_17143 [Natrialba hulunbeirensis JCM 10989]